MELTEQELFDAAISGTSAQATDASDAPEPTHPEPPQPEVPKDAARDAAGRFSPKPDQQTQPAEPPVESSREPAIPPSRLREEAEARRRAETELAELRGRLKAYEESQQRAQAPTKQPEPKPAIDPIMDPEGFQRYVDERLSSVSEQIQQQMLIKNMNGSFDRASRENGEQFTTALENFAKAANPNNGGDVRLRSEMLNSYDPARFVMEWHKRQSILSEVGDNPDGYRQKIIDEFLSNPENHSRISELLKPAQPANAAPAAPQIKLPPSLNRTTSAAPSVGGADLSDGALFENITSRRR